MVNKNRYLSLSYFMCISCTYLHAYESYVLDKVVVVAQEPKYEITTLKSYQKTGSYNYLDGKEIKQFRGSSVGDFLSGITGVIVGNKRNSGGLSVNIRGIQNENRVPIVVDDSIQSIPTWQGYSGSSTRTYLDPDFISTVEIEKGPAMGADGVGATGGVVRMNTIGYKDIIPKNSKKDWGLRVQIGTMSNTVKRPKLYTKGGYQKKWINECLSNNSGICKKQTYAPDARYSSSNPFANLGNSYNYSIAFTKKWENADIVLGYARKKQGNYFVGKHGAIPEIESIKYEREDWIEMGDDYDSIMAGNIKFKNKQGYTYYRAGEEVLNTSQDNKSYLAKLNLYNDEHRINFTYRGYRSNFGEIMPSIIVRGYGSLEGEGSEVKVDSYSTKYTYSPENPYLNLNLSAYLTNSDSSNFTPLSEEYGYDYGSDSDSRHAHFTLSTQKGVSLDNTSKFKLFNRDLKLNYGISYAIERIRPPKDAEDRVKAKGYPKDAIAPLYIRNAKKREMSAFISSNYKLTKELTLDTGLRYINSNIIDYQPYRDYNGRALYYSKPNKTHAISPIAMLSYEPISGYQFYVKYAQAVRSPSLFQATRGWSQQNADSSMADLRAERQRNWEIGTNLLFDDVLYDDSILGLKFAFFNNYTKDYLTRTNTRDSSGAIVMQTMNIDSALYRGFEASAYYDAEIFYAKLGITKYIETEFCNTEKNGKVCYKGGVINSNISNTLPPKTTFNATIGTRLFKKKLDLGARYSYYGDRVVSVFSHDEKGGNTRSEAWKPYDFVDIYANYKVNDNFTISATLDNVTNTYYLDANNMGLTPAPGRTLHINFDYKF